MHELRSDGSEPPTPATEEEWPCPGWCGTKKDDGRKILIAFFVAFTSAVSVLMSSGVVQEPEQAQEQAVHSQAEKDCPGWSHVGHVAVEWVTTSGWKQGWFPVLAILLGIHFWRGGSLTFKGRGLVGKGRRN